MLCLSMSVTLVINCLYWNWMLWCVCSSTCIIGTWMMIIHSRSEQSQNSVLSMVACTHSLCFPVISHLTFLNTKLCIWILCIWSHVNCDCWSSCMKPTSVKIQSECVFFKAQVELGGLTCKLRLHSGLCHTGIWRVGPRESVHTQWSLHAGSSPASGVTLSSLVLLLSYLLWLRLCEHKQRLLPGT